jgi:hypothetical protein
VAYILIGCRWLNQFIPEPKKSPPCTLIRLSNNPKFWICKTFINTVYAKFKGASNGVEIKIDFVRLWSFFLQNVNSFDFWFCAKNLSTPYPIKYKKIFLDAIKSYNCILFLNYASQMPSISWKKIFKIRAECKRVPRGISRAFFWNLSHFRHL